MTLVILAAGLGSRYGGLKQIDPVGRYGEFIIDYTVYDAIRAGFDKVIFIIRHEHLSDFAQTIGRRVSPHIEIAYAFQEMIDIPFGTMVDPGRTKPLGTTHAMYCCRKLLHEKFLICNADDFYGKESFAKVFEFLKTSGEEEFCMPGYKLRNTVTASGAVTRGVCSVKNGKLTEIEELKKITCDGDKAQNENEDGSITVLNPDSPVSMNFWGFSPAIMPEAERSLARFLNDPNKDKLKAENILPTFVGDCVKKNLFSFSVLDIDSHWMGVTYREDRNALIKFINERIESGEYPEKLWK